MDSIKSTQNFLLKYLQIRIKVLTFAAQVTQLPSGTTTMRITLLQTDVAWASPEVNARFAEQMIGSSPGSDLYVLPEMWSTGFATHPEGIAETEGKSLAWMRETARKANAAICGSLAIGDRDDQGVLHYRNRHYFVGRDGKEAFYDKRHLFTYGGEDAGYEPGDQRTVVSHDGWRWLLLTCYDLRFPVWSRYHGDYDGIILVANWPESRQQAWDILLRARAIENQCYVVGVNRVGEDQACKYMGGSMVIDAKGATVAACKPGEPSAVTAEIDINELRRFRSKFRVLDDRDQP